ncbi:hypothetical protein F5146DRAFT_321573 [Armillaria mellea]|nr:hypothetical protein F5146DRAFT_321573 [Armillaria mellea]
MSHKVTNTNLSHSSITSPRYMDDWELPVSRIRSWTYTLIEVFGFDMVVAFRNRALEGPLDERGMAHLACEGEVLEHHTAVSDRIMAWRGDIEATVPSRGPPIYLFDSHRRVFSFFNDEPYTPGEAPDDAPTLEALARQYDRWFLLTLLGRFRYDDRKASEGRNILRRLRDRDPSTEPDDLEDLQRSKRGERTQHHRASRDEPRNPIHDSMASVDPSGLTTTMPRQSYPPPRSHHQAYPQASPALQPPTLGLPAGSSRPFDGLALIALYKQERKIRASDSEQ